MPKQHATFQKTFEVRFCESNRHARMTPVALYNLLQESAHAHADSLGISAEAFAARGHLWMLSRLRMDVLRYPRTKEMVRVETWPSTMRGLYAVREFLVLDEAGEALAKATSRWVVIDKAKQRAVRMPPWIEQTFGIRPERALEDPFPRLPVVDWGETEKEFHVRFSELDMNQHANSASYVDWLLETVPEETLSGLAPRSAEIVFKREAPLGAELRVMTQACAADAAGHPGFLHTLRLRDAGQVLAVGRSYWGRPRTNCP